jgi:hypothetical protein
VPVAVLARAWRDAPQHQISRVLKACDIAPHDERIGRVAGIPCAAAGTADVKAYRTARPTLDAAGSATAASHPAAPPRSGTASAEADCRPR